MESEKKLLLDTVNLIRKDEWPAFKLDAIKASAKKVMGREFPFIDGRTGQEIKWEKWQNEVTSEMINEVREKTARRIVEMK